MDMMCFQYRAQEEYKKCNFPLISVKVFHTGISEMSVYFQMVLAST